MRQRCADMRLFEIERLGWPERVNRMFTLRPQVPLGYCEPQKQEGEEPALFALRSTVCAASAKQRQLHFVG
jgi:hypothetical protein